MRDESPHVGDLQDMQRSEKTEIAQRNMPISSPTPEVETEWKKMEEKHRQEREAKILANALEIKKHRSWLRATPYSDYKKGKSHRDHMLDEMAWLAKEFHRERRWKIKQARKAANSVARSNLDLESRVLVRARQEEKMIQQRAAWIAKEVSAFWNKAQRVVAFKIKRELEVKKKEALDKQLDVLIGQTQKYSSLLAARLSDKDEQDRIDSSQYHEGSIEENTRSKNPGKEYNLSSRINMVEIEPRNDNAFFDDTHEEDEDDSKNYISGDDDDEDDEATLDEEEAIAIEEGRNLLKDQQEETLGLEQDAEIPLEILLSQYGYPGYERITNTVEETNISSNSQDYSKFLKESESDRYALYKNSHESLEDLDYRSSEDDEKDDEATIEEEESLAAKEGVDIELANREEAELLEDDASIPLEEILSRYGYTSCIEEPDQKNDKHEAEAGKGHTSDYSSGPQNEQNRSDADKIAGAMEALAAVQPSGNTLATAKVKTNVPFLLKGTLREYQHIGLDWLVSLYHKRLNGILADEMGLGKTIQTIALLSWLACERGDWGPHLIVVPTSVMLNWEMEFKRWCPAFKLLTYYGSSKQRAEKRQGWSKPNAFHVCITSYTLVLQDSRMFKRKKWRYLILDEAHMIKNWRSQRWQTLLNFNSKRRLLITGTPLQNDLMELWSLMHFLMPQIFASHAQFKDWFSNPLTGMVEGSAEYNRAIIDRLHSVLRPFLLRRLKKDVEKQLPQKHEHILRCRLSKRQRQLYEEYMASGNTRATLASGNFLGIMNCLMQLRKVCNHPDLFEGRPIISAWDMERLDFQLPSIINKLSNNFEMRGLDNRGCFGAYTIGLMPIPVGHHMSSWHIEEIKALAEVDFPPPSGSYNDVESCLAMGKKTLISNLGRIPSQNSLQAVLAAALAMEAKRGSWRAARIQSMGRVSCLRTAMTPPICGDFEKVARISRPVADIHLLCSRKESYLDASATLKDMVKLPEERANMLEDILKEFVFCIPRARTGPPTSWCSHPDVSAVTEAADSARALSIFMSKDKTSLIHIPRIRTQLFFPDRRLVQFDCGKLQELAILLARLKSGNHRALIFTQMSKMLDILESFLNIHGYTYVRLDGATKPEARQVLMQRFNTDERIFCFILSTRSGGVGMNLTGADTVIFYDSDWNPAMDAQAQDRCHRIGQTREVHIYRLVSEHTIEENILRKSDQKRHLDWLAIQSGGFTTDLLRKLDPGSLLTGVDEKPGPVPSLEREGMDLMENKEEIRAAMRAVEDEGDVEAAVALEKETAAEWDEFTKEPPSISGAEGDLPPEVDGKYEGKLETSEPSTTTSHKSADKKMENSFNQETKQHYGKTGQSEEIDLLTKSLEEEPLSLLEHSLRPIERFAIRFVENDMPEIGAPEAAQLEDNYEVKDFDVDAIEAAEEEMVSQITCDRLLITCCL